MTYQSSIAYLYGLQKFGIKFGLRKVSKLLASLGNPQKGLPCIHIAGTNGKGSTAAFIASILSKAGYRVGLYTSPHLTSFTERIKINNREISKKDVKINYRKAKIGDLKYSHASIKSARKELGYNPQISLEKGLKKFLANS